MILAVSESGSMAPKLLGSTSEINYGKIARLMIYTTVRCHVVHRPKAEYELTACIAAALPYLGSGHTTRLIHMQPPISITPHP